MDNITVISLFGGMEVFRQSFKDENATIKKYLSSEIYEPSIKIANKNHDDIIQIGDITKLTKEYILSLGQIDVIGFGFPCKNLSKTVINNPNHNQGLEGESSKLFYEAIKIMNWIKETNPNVLFLCENVHGMSDEDKAIITEYLEVEPYMINSDIVSAQDRKRYYWTNIPKEYIVIPESKKLVLNDIILTPDQIKPKYWYNVPFEFHGLEKRVCATLDIKGHDILKRVNNPSHTSATLTRVTGGSQQKKVYQDERCRKLTPLEYERLQTMPDNYTEGVSDTARYCMCGDAWTKDIIRIFIRGIKRI